MVHESKILNVTVRQPKINIVPDIVYAQVPTYERPFQPLQMDLFIPQTGKLMPAVIFVTGGAFIASNRARKLQLRVRLAEKNFVVASINYRTAPNSPFPAAVEDVKSAIRFLRANSQKFSVDAEKISLIGDSAGGYIVTMAAVTNGNKIFNVGENLHVSSEIFAAVDWYGVSDLAKIAEGFPDDMQKLFNSAGSVSALFVNGVPGLDGVDGGILANPEGAQKANPLNYITENSAPMLLMHGTADNVVSPAQSDLLFQTLRNRGVEAERWLIPNAGHSDEYWYQTEVFDLVAEFLTRYAN